MSDLIPHLEITALTHGGRGIGRHDGKAVFVPLTAPGDRISCRIVRSKKSYVEAELVELKEPAVARRSPPCPYFGECGGCQWQHLTYPEQARWKEKIFSDQMIRQGLCDAQAIQPIAAAPDEWRYRNRVQFKCHMTDNGLVMGFYRHGSHFVVDVERCMLLSPPIQVIYELLCDELQECPQPGAVPQVDVATGDDGSVRVLVHVLPEARAEMRGWLQSFAERHQVSVCIQAGRKDTMEVVHGEPVLTVKVGQPEMSLQYGPGGFAQVNSDQNRRMVSTMLELLNLQGTERVLDLFCGMGNFSLPLARRVARVDGVEGYAQSIASALCNASENGIVNARFHVGDAAHFVARYRPGDVDLVVLDPPRTGSYDTVKALLNLQPDKVLYISCDPATMTRDLKPLVHGGYQVVSTQAFDLFPQTWHIESMTLLGKSGSGH